MYLLGSTGVPFGPAHLSRARTRLHACPWLIFFFFFFVSDSAQYGPIWAETDLELVFFFFFKNPWNVPAEEGNKRKRKIRTRREQNLETHLKSEATTFPRNRGSKETKKRKWKIRIERMMDWVCEKEWVGEKEWITWVGLDIGKSEFQEVSNYLKCWLYLKNAINDFFF